ncbi:MAG: sulfatase-like hydrolase/transferase [Planctomycetes bacterium]|nr:sulfatase-like hydrolase/transferase [Planctomycetota bacterium]
MNVHDDARGDPQRGWLSLAGFPLSVAALCLTLLLPKLVLTRFASERMFTPYDVWETTLALQQDLLVAALAGAGLLALGQGATRLRWIGVGLGLGSVLFLLLVDLRARELWLKPLDLGMLGYLWSNFGDLRSGATLFFNHNAGLGMTFRRMLVVFGGLYGGLWGLSYAALFLGPRAAAPAAGGSRRRVGRRVAGGVLAALFVTSACVSRQRYRIDENILVRPAVNLVRDLAQGAGGQRELAAAHDQRARPLSEALTSPRVLVPEAPPFRNALIVILESARWASVDLEGVGPTLTPTLRRLAGEGLRAKCYVALPHSSKAYYAILSGRHPFPGIDMRESLSEHEPSLMWAARQQLQADVSVYTSAYLAFENTHGLLAALGVERRVESGPAQGEEASSFGRSDAPLYAMVPPALASGRRPFVSCVINLGAHYPYGYPGKPPTDGEGLQAYERVLAHADAQLGDFVAELSAAGVLDAETLLVLVGDHGESFGEHGSFVHNNSLYEEEVTVPLIFWSADGRLRHDAPLVAQQIDVAPTVADLLGLEDGAWRVQGRSLLREGGAPIYLTTFFEGVGQALIEGSTKYLYEPDSGRLVEFDLAADPAEERPTEVEGATRAAVVRRLQAFRAYQRAAFPD